MIDRLRRALEPFPLPEPAPRWTGHHLLVLALLLAIGITLGWLARAPDVLTGGDDLTYLLLSQSLARGEYRDVFLVGAPPHIQYPPGMPAWLLLIRTLFGPGLGTVQAAQLILVAATAALVGDGLRRLGHPWLGVAAAGVIATNRMLLELAGTMMSETLFTFWVAVTAWSLLRGAGANPPRWHGLAMLASAAGFLTRLAGLALPVAVAAVLLWHRRWRALLVHGGISLVVVGAWFTYTSRAEARALGHSYGMELTVIGQHPESGTFVGRAVGSLIYQVQVSLPEVLGLPMIPGTVLDNIAWTAVLLTAMAAGAVVAVRAWLALPLMLGAMLGVVLLWPWTLARLALPMLPLAVPMMLLGAWAVGTRVRVRGGGRLAAVALAVVLMAASGWRGAVAVREVQQCPRGSEYTVVSPCHDLDQVSLVAGAHLAARVLGPGDVLATYAPTVVFYFAGIQAIPTKYMPWSPPTAPVAYLAEAGATHLLVPRFKFQDLGPVLEACSGFAVTAWGDPDVLILEPRAPNSEEPDACDDLRQLATAVGAATETGASRQGVPPDS